MKKPKFTLKKVLSIIWIFLLLTHIMPALTIFCEMNPPGSSYSFTWQYYYDGWYINASIVIIALIMFLTIKAFNNV